MFRSLVFLLAVVLNANSVSAVTGAKTFDATQPPPYPQPPRALVDCSEVLKNFEIMGEEKRRALSELEYARYELAHATTEQDRENAYAAIAAAEEHLTAVNLQYKLAFKAFMDCASKAFPETSEIPVIAE